MKNVAMTGIGSLTTLIKNTNRAYNELQKIISSGIINSTNIVARYTFPNNLRF